MSKGIILKREESMEGVCTESSGRGVERVAGLYVFFIIFFGRLAGEAGEFNVPRAVGEEK